MATKLLSVYNTVKDNENHLTNVYGDDYFSGNKEGDSNYMLEKASLINTGRNYARKLARRMPWVIYWMLEVQ